MAAPWWRVKCVGWTGTGHPMEWRPNLRAINNVVAGGRLAEINRK
jgi:hypothetical protein